MSPQVPPTIQPLFECARRVNVDGIVCRSGRLANVIGSCCRDCEFVDDLSNCRPKKNRDKSKTIYIRVYDGLIETINN